MWSEIEEELKRADHLFYVSLKYTKTGDVILNLLQRWERVLELCMELLLREAKKRKRIKEIPSAPKARELAVRQLYEDELIAKVMDFYAFLRALPGYEKIRENEFRKNVALRVIGVGKEVRIDMEKLKEWRELVCESFVKLVRHIA